MNYNIAQQKAWNNLTEIEQSVLSLIIVNNRSKQESSVILGISQYKLTEYYLRARKLFIEFTRFYELYDLEYSVDLLISELQFIFLKEILEHRKHSRDIIYNNPKLKDWVSSSERDRIWDYIIKSLQLSRSPYALALYSLLITYDKWNTFRVLPKEYQKVSPFPRRRNRSFKRIFEQLSKLSEMSWGLLEEEFSDLSSGAYIPSLNGEPSIIQVRVSGNALAYYNRNKLPVFNSPDLAREFALIIFYYQKLKVKSPYSAQKFWANFRIKIKSAINYAELLHLKPGELVGVSDRDKDFLAKAKVFSKRKKAQIKPTPSGEFWELS